MIVSRNPTSTQRLPFRKSHSLLCLSLLLSVPVFSGELVAQERDTVDVDVRFAEAEADTVSTEGFALRAGPTSPIPLLGSIDRFLPDDERISPTHSLWNEYTTFNHIAAIDPGVFVVDMGSSGQYSGLSIRGLDGRTIAYLHDGTLLNDPLTGTYNASWYQTEQFDRLEIETGTRAFLYGWNSTGGAINVVTAKHRALRPRTRIRYSETAYEETHFDGMITQNITSALNVDLGVQRDAFDGRFRNSFYDAWNVRAKVRYDLDDRITLFLSELHTKSKLGLFGGVDAYRTHPAFLFDRLQANVVSLDAFEKNTRHDFQMGAGARVFADTLHVTTFTLHHSSLFREFRRIATDTGPEFIKIEDDHLLRWQGARLTQHFDFRQYSLNAGTEITSHQVRRSPATGYRAEVSRSVHAKLEISPVNLVRFAGYGRIDNFMNQTPRSYGADIVITPTPMLRFHGGYSRSFRFPTFQELYWRSEGIKGPSGALLPERHHLIEAGARLHVAEKLALNVKYFHRIIRDAITIEGTGVRNPFPGIRFRVREKVNIDGIEARASARLWKFQADGQAQYLLREVDGLESTNLPQWTASGGLYFWDELLGGDLELKAGIRGRLIGEQSGMEFNPEAIMYVPGESALLGTAVSTDIVIIGKISSAYVHIIWQNIFNNQYIITRFYPMPDRAVRFGLTWELLD